MAGLRRTVDGQTSCGESRTGTYDARTTGRARVGARGPEAARRRHCSDDPISGVFTPGRCPAANNNPDTEWPVGRQRGTQGFARVRVSSGAGAANASTTAAAMEQWLPACSVLAPWATGNFRAVTFVLFQAGWRSRTTAANPPQ